MAGEVKIKTTLPKLKLRLSSVEAELGKYFAYLYLSQLLDYSGIKSEQDLGLKCSAWKRQSFDFVSERGRIFFWGGGDVGRPNLTKPSPEIP